MYRCLECKRIFEEPLKIYQNMTGVNYYYESECPYCNGAYESIEQCQCCGEYVDELNEHNGEYICDNCLEEENNS